MKKIKEFFNLTNKEAGILEYLFGLLAVLSVMPAVITYFMIIMIIVRPIVKLKEILKELVNSVWK